uniref:DNA cytosine methyltransferase n=1 Tax=Staphylococcus arlettae TaxID=29378 RepID=UPI0011A9B012
MKFIDLFSGIGGFRSALEMNGHECLAFAEIDKYARQSYKAIYNTENEQEWHDVTRITDDDFRYFKGKADIITGGFPCQTFSIAGKRAGFEDTRGTLFFEIARAIKEIQPSYVLLENVKGLFSHDGGRTFGTIIQTLDELGFITEWGLFNSKYWGVPQNRERVYILATRKDKFKEPLLFDLVKQQTEVTTRLIDVLEDEVDEKYYLSEEKTKNLTLNEDLSGRLNMYNYRQRDEINSANKVSPTLNTMQGGDRQPKIAVLGNTSHTGYKAHDVHDINGLSPTIAARDYKGSKQIAVREATKQGYTIAEQGDSVNVSYPTSKTRRGRVGKQVAQTLQAGEVNQGVVIGVGHHPFSKKREFNGYGLICPTLIATDYKAPKTALTNDLRIRKLVPIETWRLQGFTDEQF